MHNYLRAMVGLAAMSAAATVFMLADLVEGAARLIGGAAELIAYVLDDKQDDWRLGK